MKQVTERLERTLQETPHLDFLRSFTRAGVSTIFVNLDGKTNAQQVADTWYLCARAWATCAIPCPQALSVPAFNDEFGDTFGIIYGVTADGFSHRELRDHVENASVETAGREGRLEDRAAWHQDEQIFIEFSMEDLANLGVDRSALLAALQAQNAVRPAGLIETDEESISLRVSGSFESEQDIANVNFAVGNRMLRLADIATIRRGYADPPQPMFRVNGTPAIGLAVAMRDGGDILQLGENIKQVMADAKAELPLGVEPILVADQAVTWKVRSRSSCRRSGRRSASSCS